MARKAKVVDEKESLKEIKNTKAIAKELKKKEVSESVKKELTKELNKFKEEVAENKDLVMKEIQLKANKEVTESLDNARKELQKSSLQELGNIKNEVRKEVKLRVDELNKKALAQKNRKIIVRDLIILILLTIIGLIIFGLWQDKYLDKVIKEYILHEEVVKEEQKEVINTDTTKEEDKTPTLEDLKVKYSYLLNNIVINEDSTYIEDFYSKDLTDELKLYIAFNNLDTSKISVDEDSTTIESDDLESKYKDIIDSSYTPKSFKYNKDISLKYISSKSLYLSQSTIKKEASKIKREIIKITESNNEVEITTIEGLLDNNNLSNIVTKKEIENYSNNKSLSLYETDLTKVTYVFNTLNGKLIKLK